MFSGINMAGGFSFGPTRTPAWAFRHAGRHSFALPPVL